MIGVDYVERAKEFLKKIGAKVTITFKDCTPVPDWDDDRPRNNYRVRIDRNGKTWSYIFHDSLHNTWNHKRPTPYDVLACVETYDVGSIDDFVSEFGYEVSCWADVKKIQRIYKAVKKEAANYQRIFGDVAEEMRDVFT